VDSSALVLGAGGITGIAWQLGVVIGLRQRGVDLTAAGLVVGTSAGAVTGALLATGVDPADAAVIEARLGPDEPPLRPDWTLGAQAFALLTNENLDAREVRAGIGALALAADVGDEDALVASFARRLPVHAWPARRLLVTVVDTADGAPVAWDRDAGVPLVRAVAASCAVPCLFPPVTVNGGRYMDGGVRSRTNADLAAGCDPIVVLAPRMPMLPGAGKEVDALRASATVVLVTPDPATADAVGRNVFDTTRWKPVLEAGIAQGRARSAEIGAVWRG
jgi:NTE family protein